VPAVRAHVRWYAPRGSSASASSFPHARLKLTPVSRAQPARAAVILVSLQAQWDSLVVRESRGGSEKELVSSVVRESRGGFEKELVSSVVRESRGGFEKELVSS
jgi:hypothetical protein